MRVNLFFENTEGKEELKNYLLNEIAQDKVSALCLVTDKQSRADILIDLEDLTDKEHIAVNTSFILKEIYRVYLQKKPKIFLQRNQKKIRRRNWRK